MPFHGRKVLMPRFKVMLIGLACSAILAGAAHAQTVAALSHEPVSFFERLFGGLASPLLGNS
jgi:hypothetical protein